MNNSLCELAINAAKNSYSPYSGFKVGAALLCDDGSIYLGTNVENASYSATICAERIAFVKAVSEGKRNFVAIAVAGGRENVGEEICNPCGTCCQTMAEFCDADKFKILLPHKNGCEELLLRDLLPHSFKIEV